MAKGQKRTSKEIRKPKQAKPKDAPLAAAALSKGVLATANKGRG